MRPEVAAEYELAPGMPEKLFHPVLGKVNVQTVTLTQADELMKVGVLIKKQVEQKVSRKRFKSPDEEVGHAII
jgi:hypothetical protein